jgi:dihydrofolate synthase/folylpolyglutamate synthase
MSINLSYNDCLSSMFRLGRFGIKLGLDTIRCILEGLGNPQNTYSCIHVAGTNGKGSIASYLATILHASGYKVGLYTSPHLVSFNERIRINNAPVSDECVVESFEAVKKVHHGSREPTFFEFATAMALYEFGKQHVDWAVIETGMGGRLDATNIIQPLISVISNISVEHTMYLGHTIAQIAGEKGGIIKDAVPVVIGVKQPSAVKVIEDISKNRSASCYRYGKDFYVKRSKKGTFAYYGMETVWRDMQTSLAGEYQIDNAAIALAVCEILCKAAADIPEHTIREGLMKTRWPGRLEIVSTSPLIILDGAHNLAASRKLASFLSKQLAGRHITLVLGILDDKPYAAMLRCLLPFCNKLILTRPDIDRAIEPEKLFNVAKSLVSDIQIIPEVGNAVCYAIKNVPADGAVCIAGSLYVVGEAKKKIEHHFL